MSKDWIEENQMYFLADKNIYYLYYCVAQNESEKQGKQKKLKGSTGVPSS